MNAFSGWHRMIAAALVVPVLAAACGTQAAVSTPHPSPTPLAPVAETPALTPEATPTPEPSPTGTPTPTPTPTKPPLPKPPSAPHNVTWYMPCSTSGVCKKDGSDDVVLQWGASSGLVQGYRIYYTHGTCPDIYCLQGWTAIGGPHMAATVSGSRHSWTGPAPVYSKISVVALSAGGASAPAYGPPLDNGGWEP